MRAVLGVWIGMVGYSALASVSLSPAEQREVTQRLHRFSQTRDPAVLSEVPPKFSVDEKTFVHPNPMLRAPFSSSNPLREGAGLKATREYQSQRCQGLIRRHFPSLDCSRPPEPRWSRVEDNDRVADLVPTWIEKKDLVLSLDGVPAAGQSKLPLWSGSYWATNMGGLSHRYALGKIYKKYADAVNAYQQPAELRALKESSPDATLRRLLQWSPSEKYDLMVGDSDFGMTKAQKEQGKKLVGENGEVPYWFGVCDGWAAASVMVPRPTKFVKVAGLDGKPVGFYPQDVRALASLQWSSWQVPFNSIGGRCDSKRIEIFGNGRIVDQNCFDTNPATFHLALGNLIGRKQLSFVMDAAYDAEVWNQPIQAYHFTYFNPLDTERTSEDWKRVAVKYDDTFKEVDRFQKPLTRGKRVGRERWDDTGIEKVVGVIATVTYLGDRAVPKPAEIVEKETLLRTSYTYDLELSTVDGKLVATGGEWYQNAHPDFLWLPKKGSVPIVDGLDDQVPDVKTDVAPAEPLKKIAQHTSPYNYPLCKVVSALVEKSSGKPYPCTRPTE